MALRSVCRSLHASIDEDACSFWRRRFLGYFDKPIRPTTNLKYKEMYQERRRLLSSPPRFVRGKSAKEVTCLEYLRDLVLGELYGAEHCECWLTSATESWSEGSPASVQQSSLNIRYLTVFALRNSDILCKIFRPVRKQRSGKRSETPNDLLHTMQVMFAPLILNLQTPNLEVYRYPDSQRAAYATRLDQPLFRGLEELEVDMEWVLHQINFWKYHMVRREESTLFVSFENLKEEEMDTPRMWEHSIHAENGRIPQHIGRIWKTCFAFLDHTDLELIRSGAGEDLFIQDTFEYEACEDAFPECQLRRSDKDNDVDTWPALFERYLHSLRPAGETARTRTRSQPVPKEHESRAFMSAPQKFTFDDFGHLSHDFHGEGWLTALPPQSGIPGWRRLTMMKFDPQDFASADLWAYEGVVLPGGMIIIGRWWEPGDQPNERVYSGPFIMWCVDSLKRAADTGQDAAITP